MAIKWECTTNYPQAEAQGMYDRRLGHQMVMFKHVDKRIEADLNYCYKIGWYRMDQMLMCGNDA